MNEQVRKHTLILEELKGEIAEIDRECAWLMDDNHPHKGLSGFPNLIKVVRHQKHKDRLEKSLTERQRILDGKIERREEWLSGKREVARRRIQKVLDRSMSVEDLVVSENSAEGLDEAIRVAGEWQKFLVAKKELAVMLEDVFEGRAELEEADEVLLGEILEVFS